jgi:hypothetical protein
MMGRLVPLGEKATQEMVAENLPHPTFDSAAADAARKIGFSDEEIVDLLGYLPPPLLSPDEESEENSSEDDFLQHGFG